MALFFDTQWFDARLGALGLSRAIVAAALGVAEDDVALVWKDQRELSAREVAVLAQLLAVTPQEIAKHAGVSTPVPKPGGDAALEARVDALEARLERIERMVAEIRAAVSRRS